MERSAVKIGDTYTLQVAGRTTQVRITEEKRKGEKHTGFIGVDLATNRNVYVNSALRLKPLCAPGDDERECGPDGGQAGAPDSTLDRIVVAANKRGTTGTTAGSAHRKKKRVAPAGSSRKTRQKSSGKLSGLDAAAKVLMEASGPLRVTEIVELAKAKGYWESKTGKTPAATIYAAIVREIRDKGADSRFVKVDRGSFRARE